MANQNAPRKFSEKIAIMERKLNEDEDAFSKVMREVREITTPTSALQPGQWNGPGGGSLPNMHQVANQSQPYWPEPPRGRSRSPGSHYHPYRAHQRSQERVPPLHGPAPPYQITQPIFSGLIPPEQWNGVGRAHSAPSINMQMSPISPVMSPYGPPPMTPYHDGSAQHSPIYSGSPTMFNGGSPVVANGGGSPIFNGTSSPVHMMPRPDDGRQEMVGSLPNIPPAFSQVPGPSCYHAQVGQRHSTGCGTRLAPSYTPESQSAPTSPAQMAEHSLAPVWPAPRTYSNSPEALDIPNIVLTEADGLEGARLDCYDHHHAQMNHVSDGSMGYDVNLQDLRIDSNDPLCNGTNYVHDPSSIYQ